MLLPKNTYLKPILIKSVSPSALVFKIGKFGLIGLHTSFISCLRKELYTAGV